MKSSSEPKTKLKNNLKHEHKIFVSKHYFLLFLLKIIQSYLFCSCFFYSAITAGRKFNACKQELDGYSQNILYSFKDESKLVSNIISFVVFFIHFILFLFSFLTETVLPVVAVLQTYQKCLSLNVQHLFWEFKRMAKIIPEGKLHGDLLLENKER